MKRLASLPNFTSYTYAIAVKPAGAHLRAWAKLQECERRIVWLRWLLEGVKEDPVPVYHHILEDAITAGMLTFEAGYEQLRDQWRKENAWGRKKEHFEKHFRPWVMRHSRYTLAVKGVRTLRHFEAHVELQRSRGGIHYTIGPGVDSATALVRRYWLPELTVEKWTDLTAPAVKKREIAEWQVRFAKRSADDVLAEALTDLVAIVGDAEAHWAQLIAPT